MEVVYRESCIQGVGLSPGDIPITSSDGPATPTRLRVLGYGADGCFQLETTSVAEALGAIGEKTVTWIQVIGIRQVSLIREIGQKLNIHPLALEDVATTCGRAKMQDYGSQLLVVGKAAVLDAAADRVNIEQVSMIMGANYLVTFQETESKLFEPVELRIMDPQRYIRKQIAGYLLYALLDTLVDHLLVSVEAVEEEVIVMEDAVLENRSVLDIQAIYRHKLAVILLSRMASPMQELAKRLEMIDNEMVPDSLDYYYRNLNDHATRAAERITHARAVLQNLQEFYHVEGDRKNNDVMRVLTVVATIFIPMTFVTGIYGMNFNTSDGPLSMPELNTPYGYPICLTVLGLYALLAFRYFRRKGWFK